MKEKNTKKYLKIYETVRDDIIAGRYKVGSKLPSKRVMAESMDVSNVTVEHAYELLAEEGYIFPKEKCGYIVTYEESNSYNAPKTMESTRTGNITVHQPHTTRIDFSYSIYAKTARRILSEYGEEIMEKSPTQGTPVLREAICEYLSRSRRIEVEPSQVYIGAGAEYLYTLIVQVFGRNLEYGIESPSYQKIAEVYRSGGAGIDMLPLSDDGIESKSLWETKAKVLHITPYRSFPSGVTASAGKKREYLRWSEEKDALMIEDDFESEFTPSRKPEETLFSLDKNGRVIYVNTFTKTIGAFVRTAYMLIPKRFEELFREKLKVYSCPVPTLEQYIIAGLIRNGDFERHINKVRRYNRNGNIDKKELFPYIK